MNYLQQRASCLPAFPGRDRSSQCNAKGHLAQGIGYNGGKDSSLFGKESFFPLLVSKPPATGEQANPEHQAQHVGEGAEGDHCTRPSAKA